MVCPKNHWVCPQTHKFVGRQAPALCRRKVALHQWSVVRHLKRCYSGMELWDINFEWKIIEKTCVYIYVYMKIIEIADKVHTKYTKKNRREKLADFFFVRFHFISMKISFWHDRFVEKQGPHWKSTTLVKEFLYHLHGNSWQPVAFPLNQVMRSTTTWITCLCTILIQCKWNLSKKSALWPNLRHLSHSLLERTGHWSCISSKCLRISDSFVRPKNLWWWNCATQLKKYVCKS